MRCLITGVSGLIGSNLAERLLADEHEVAQQLIGYEPLTSLREGLAQEFNDFASLPGKMK